MYRDQAGELLVGRTGHGRGAWLCRHSLLDCFDAAVSSRGFERALKASLDHGRLGTLRHDLEERVAAERTHQSNGDGGT